MSIKKDLPRRPLQSDPAVDTHMGDDPVYGRLASRSGRARNMTSGKRKKAERDAQRKKVTFDWPEELIERIDELANQKGERVPANQLTALLMRYALRALDAGEIDLEKHKLFSRVPRFDWFLETEIEHSDE